MCRFISDNNSLIDATSDSTYSNLAELFIFSILVLNLFEYPSNDAFICKYADVMLELYIL